MAFVNGAFGGVGEKKAWAGLGWARLGSSRRLGITHS